MHRKTTLCNAFAKLQLVGDGIFPASRSPWTSPASFSRMVPLLPQLLGSLMAGGAVCDATSPKSCNEPSLQPPGFCLAECLWWFPCLWAQMGLHLPPGSPRLLEF